jgi:hypothetical protein
MLDPQTAKTWIYLLPFFRTFKDNWLQMDMGSWDNNPLGGEEGKGGPPPNLPQRC